MPNNNGKSGYESEALLLRQAQQIVSQLPEDGAQAKRVLTYACKLLDYEKRLVREVTEPGRDTVPTYLRALTTLAVVVYGLRKIPWEAALVVVV